MAKLDLTTAGVERLGRRASAAAAAIVLALATGLPLRSAATILPGPEDTGSPYLGI